MLETIVAAQLSWRSARCPLSAMCGRLRVGKGFLHVCSIGRCSHVFGLLVRHTWPLAIIPSADQVPVISTHSTMRGNVPRFGELGRRCRLMKLCGLYIFLKLVSIRVLGLMGNQRCSE